MYVLHVLIIAGHLWGTAAEVPFCGHRNDSGDNDAWMQYITAVHVGQIYFHSIKTNYTRTPSWNNVRPRYLH